MKSHRLKIIEEYILDKEVVTLDTLCDVFNVSKNTIRRDINEIVKKGRIKKIYGGVTANTNSLVPFEERNIKNISEKKLVAKCAASFIKGGDIIYIDSGTTTLYMTDFLKEKSNVTILTNNLNVITNTLQYPNLNVIATGGNLNRTTNSFTGTDTITILKNYNINKAFMASAGVSISKGVTNSSPFEYDIKKLIVEKSDEVYLLVDSSKINTSSLVTYCNLDEIDHLITNKFPDKEYVDFFKKVNVKLTLAQ